MTAPRVHHRAAGPRDRDVRLSRLDSAADSIGPVHPGMDVYCLTFGQFDLSDVIEHLLDGVGRASVVVATWTAGAADLERAGRLLDDDRLESVRFIVDQSFPNRQPAYYEKLLEKFGAASVTMTRSHCKFLLVSAGDYRMVVRTSMNLNANRRLENLEISDDAELFAFMETTVDEVFGEGGSKQPPALAGMEGVNPPQRVRTGHTIRVGR